MTEAPRMGFVVAPPRSGTTWLARMLSAHPEVHGAELRLFGPHADFLHDERVPFPRLRITLDRYADAAARHLDDPALGTDFSGLRRELISSLGMALARSVASLSRKPVLVDKITPYHGTARTVVERIGEFFPGAPVVRLLRDGRDIAVSGVHHWLRIQDPARPRSAHAEARRAWLLNPAEAPAPSRFFEDEDLSFWGRFFEEVVGAFDGPPAMEVRYESMRADTAGVLAALLRVLGVDPAHAGACAASASFEASNGAGRPDAPARSGASGQWPSYFTREDGAVFEDIAGEALRASGYTAGRAWIDTLPRRFTPAAALSARRPPS